jgi:hypothetical protein
VFRDGTDGLSIMILAIARDPRFVIKMGALSSRSSIM